MSLDALASPGSMLESQRVSHSASNVFEILSNNAKYCVRLVVKIVVIASRSASSVSIFFYLKPLPCKLVLPARLSLGVPVGFKSIIH